MNNILASLLSKPAVSVVDVSTGLQVFKSAKVAKVKIKLVSKMQRHQMEDGAIITDARIILPYSVEMDVISPDLVTMDSIGAMAVNRATVYALTSKGIKYGSLMCEEMTFKHSPNMLSSTPVSLKLKQLLLQDSELAIKAQPSDSSVVNRGMAALNGAKKTVGDLASAVANKISGVL